MSIIAAELIAYQAANTPESDTVTGGGAINANGLVAATQMAAAGFVDYVSSSASDTATTVTVTGRDNTGTIVSETKTLNGTTTVNGAQTFQRILKVTLGGTAPVGTVTVKEHTGGATKVALTSGQSWHCLFYAAQSSSSSKTIYDKYFWKNTDATLTLQNAQVTLTVDASTELLQGIATAVNDTATIANRLTAPAGITFVGLSTAQNVPGGGLAAGAGVGVWMEENLPANAAAFMESFTGQINGGTT